MSNERPALSERAPCVSVLPYRKVLDICTFVRMRRYVVQVFVTHAHSRNAQCARKTEPSESRRARDRQKRTTHRRRNQRATPARLNPRIPCGNLLVIKLGLIIMSDCWHGLSLRCFLDLPPCLLRFQRMELLPRPPKEYKLVCHSC